MQIIIVAAYFQDIGVAIYRLIRWLSLLCCLHMITFNNVFMKSVSYILSCLYLVKVAWLPPELIMPLSP